MTAVALVGDGAALAGYLEAAGFAVHACDEPPARRAIVWLAGEAEELAPRVRAWLDASAPRVVVVTSRPAALRDLLGTHATRLVVLPAPAFAWDVADALRAGTVSA